MNTALGIRKLKAAKFTEAEQHFRTAIKRLSTNYTSPKDGEPFYYLGVALESQGKHDDAFDAFLKASWSEAWRGPAYFAAAQIDAQRNDFAAALDHVDRSLLANGLNLQALNLKSAVLRHLGRTTDALAVVEEAARRVDPLDVGLPRNAGCWGANRPMANWLPPYASIPPPAWKQPSNTATPAYGTMAHRF